VKKNSIGFSIDSHPFWKYLLTPFVLDEEALHVRHKLINVEEADWLSPWIERFYEVTDFNYYGRKHNFKRQKINNFSDIPAELAGKIIVEKELFYHEILLAIADNQAPVYPGLDRNSPLPSVSISVFADPLIPKVAFARIEDGLEYSLTLYNGEKTLQIQHQKVEVVQAMPAWIWLGSAIYQIPGIKGGFIRPFVSKEKVFIPSKLEIDFFKMVISPITRFADFDMHGFDQITYNVVNKIKIQIYKHPYTKHFAYQPVFYYGPFSFRYNEHVLRRNKLEVSDQGKPHFLISIRNAAQEQLLTEQIAKYLGATRKESSFEFDSMDLTPESIGERIKLLEKDNTVNTRLEIDILHDSTKKYNLEKAHFEISAKANKDWFNVHISISVGAFTLRFSDIYPFINQGLFEIPLPDNSIFIIPLEWHTKLAELSVLMHPQKTGNQLPKACKTWLIENQIPVLEKLPSKKSLHSEKCKAPAWLRPYQKKGFDWLFESYSELSGVLLADEMGLGKTAQVIAFSEALLQTEWFDDTRMESQSPAALQLSLFDIPTLKVGRKKPSICVICPSSLMYNWASEFQKFYPGANYLIHHGNKRAKKTQSLTYYDIVISSYGTLRQDAEFLANIHWHCIVFDEMQYLKNPETALFEAAQTLPAEFKIGMSGTPIENSIGDIQALFDILQPNAMPNLTRIVERNSNTGTDLVRKIIGKAMLRRTKLEVEPDLPELTIQNILVEMSGEHWSAYETFKSGVRNEILEKYSNQEAKIDLNILQKLMRLRQIACHPKLADEAYSAHSNKMEMVLEKLSELIANGQSCLIFSNFEKHLFILRDALEGIGLTYAWLSGSSTVQARKQAVSDFEDGKKKIMLMTIKAGGTGLNLLAASHIFILDPWWNPATEEQAIARAHRIGQTKSVHVHKFIAKDSIEENILQLQKEKKLLAEHVLNAALEKITPGDLLRLLN
jgi:superfamily II DNA or RNA helicase